MSLDLAILPQDAVQGTCTAMREASTALAAHQRPFVQRQIRAAIKAGLLEESEVSAALVDPCAGSALIELGGTLLRRFTKQCMKRLPKIDPSARLSQGADWMGDKDARVTLRGWLEHFQDRRFLSVAQIRRAVGEGDAAVFALVGQGWENHLKDTIREVQRKVGPVCVARLELGVYPSILDGADSLCRERGANGVVVETERPILFTMDSLHRHAADDRMPLLMAGLEAFCRHIKSIHVITPREVLDGEAMCCEWMDAVKYQAADAVQPDGSIVIPDMLIEQLAEEFGMDLTDGHGSRGSVERLLAFYNDEGTLSVSDLVGNDLLKAMGVGARRGGVVGSVLKVLARAITHLEANALPRADIEYSSDEEAYAPTLIFTGCETGLEDDALSYQYSGAMENGYSFANILDSDTNLGGVASLALREACCISCVVAALELLND